MRRKILIEKRDNRIRTYFCEDGEIVEIHSTAASGNREDRHRLGDIYIGRVSNIVPNIGAAFIEIEKGINCYYDMKDAAHAIFTHKSGKKHFASVMNWSYRSAVKRLKAKHRLSPAI